jgi:hypothetical protein
MTWTITDLQTTDSALGIDDIAAAAAAINQQKITLTQQDTAIVDMQRVLLSSATGDWAKIVARSRMSLTGTAVDGAILAAINACALVNAAQAGTLRVVQTSVPEIATAFNQSLQGLLAVGDITQDSVNSIEALQTVIKDQWIPPVTAGDIQTARSQPSVVTGPTGPVTTGPTGV